MIVLVPRQSLGDTEHARGFRTFGVNVLSHFWLVQAFLPGMIAAGNGHIVSVASLLGITGNAQLSKYSLATVKAHA